MKPSYFAIALCALPLACGSSTPEPNEAPAPPPPAAVEPPPAPPAPPPPPEPTAEEKKKAEQAKQLAEARAKMQADAKAELERFTPELRAEAKALSEKGYPSLKAGLDAALKGKHRKPGNAERDKYRHPAETLAFFGLRPNMTVIEYSPGEGWFTELLAPVLASKGKLMITMGDPNGPETSGGTLYAQRIKHFLDKSPELYGKVDRLVVDAKKPDLNVDGKVDMVVVMRGMHGWAQQKTTSAWLAEIHDSLKPNGVLGVEQHRANPGANPEESAKQGYLPEAWVVQQVEAAGFKLAGKSEVNANPKDTKDYPEGVWTLPPTFELGEKDRAKYEAIGESDRMTLKFVKVAKKKAAAAP